MRCTTVHSPPFSFLRVELAAGERLVADAGTMVARDPAVRLGVALDVGRARGAWARLRALFAALVRKLVGGEHALLDRFDAPVGAGGWVHVAPAFAGALAALELHDGHGWTIAPGAFLAAGPDVHLEVRWAGLGALFSREASFWLEASGCGELHVAGRGVLERVPLDGPWVVEAGHLVAFSAGVVARVRKKRLAPWSTRPEPQMVELSGAGEVLVQTRSTRALVARLTPLLPE